MLKQLRHGSAEATAVLDRTTRMAGEIDAQVGAILAEVRVRGDNAVSDYTRRFDKREPLDGTNGSYEITRDRWETIAGQ